MKIPGLSIFHKLWLLDSGIILLYNYSKWVYYNEEILNMSNTEREGSEGYAISEHQC